MVRFAIALLILVATPSAIACSCAGMPTARDKIDNATFIFSGRVVATENPQQARLDAIADPAARNTAWRAGVDKSLEEGWGPHHGTRVVFDDVKVYSGTASQTVELWTGQGGGDCGLTFAHGLTYLVFAQLNKAGRVTAGLCGGTRPAVCSRDELLLLGEPESLVLPSIDDPVEPERIPCLQWPKLETDRNLEGLIRGRIDVDLVIDREGRVSHLAFQKPQRAELERIVRSWCFTPAKLDGKPIPVRLRYISPTDPN